MKKICLNTRFGIEDAVLQKRTNHIRKLIKLSSLNEKYIENIFEEENQWKIQYNNHIIDLPKESYPLYKKGEIVAIAQSYADCGNFPEYDFDEDDYPIMPKRSGFFNKSLVRADLMPYQIRINGIKAKRMQEIKDNECIEECIIKGKVGSNDTHFMDAYYIPSLPLDAYCTVKRAYSILMDMIYGKGTWERNPWVWIYEFELIK